MLFAGVLGCDLRRLAGSRQGLRGRPSRQMARRAYSSATGQRCQAARPLQKDRRDILGSSGFLLKMKKFFSISWVPEQITVPCGNECKRGPFF